MSLTILLAAAAIAGINPLASQPMHPTAADHAPGSCHTRKAPDGYLLPDPNCTPGAINPTLTVSVLLNPNFRTDTVRDKVTSEAMKRKVYGWYGITPPANNTGQSQICELDHVIDLGAGGADTLDNIWPQCGGPNSASLPVGQREFKIKDRFAEHDVIALIKAGHNLLDLQQRISTNWTQFITPGAQ